MDLRLTSTDDFAAAVIEGLSAVQKSIPSRFFYDARGAALFEEITRLDEYYLTRTETKLLTRYAGEIAELVGRGAVLVEYGAGSGRKTQILLETLEDLTAYVPVDISPQPLAAMAETLRKRYPHIPISPVIADFNAPFELPRSASRGRRIGFFPGSTIGNLTPADAVDFLRRAGRQLGRQAGFLIGTDLKKAPEILLAAYNDAKGVTAAFNFNLLHRINRELGGDFDVDGFAHEAVYDADHGRIEMYLMARRAQTVHVSGRTFTFGQGERIHTENSYKYAMDEFRLLARAGGWEPVRSWSDANGLFGVHYLVRFEND